MEITLLSIEAAVITSFATSKGIYFKSCAASTPTNCIASDFLKIQLSMHLLAN